MNSIFVHGIYTKNVGDDLFLKILLERYPSTKMVMLAPDEYKHLLGGYANCVVVSESDKTISSLVRICKFIHAPKNLLVYIYLFIKYRITLFLIIGGSLFIVGNSNTPSLLNGLKKMRFLFPKLKIAILGSNFGPTKTKKWCGKVAEALAVCEDVCFRDKASYELFSALPMVRWGNDIVMHAEAIKKYEVNKSICVNIRSVDSWPTLKPYKEAYLSNTLKIVNYFIEKGYSVQLLSFCERYGDEVITDELYNLIENKDNVHKHYYRGNIDEIIEVISSSEFMVGTRFHAIIIGLVYGLRVLPISYSVKTENALKSIGRWNDKYIFQEFCKAEINDLVKCFIDHFSVDKSLNTQFTYLDNKLTIR